jgi:hypothetical protein
MSNTLEDLVEETLQHFMGAEMLFTALDVSNEVKKKMPLSRHREIRDIVRQLFNSHIEPNDYARTPIKVQLADGTNVDALLYHNLSDSWNLDNKYSAQQRSQTAVRPTVAQAVTPTPAPVTPAPVSVPATATVTISAPVTFSAAKTAWDNLFNTQPSLFPTK